MAGRFLMTVVTGMTSVLLAAPAVGQEAGPDVGSAADELLAADRAFARETAARGVDGWVEAFAPDGAMVSGDGEIVGHAAIREAMAGFLGDPEIEFRWEPERAEAAPAGDWGFTIGRYTVRRRPAAAGAEPELLERGRYLTVWRREDDGRWRVVADIGDEATSEPTG